MSLANKAFAALQLIFHSPLKALRSAVSRIFILSNKLITIDRLDVFVCDSARIPLINKRTRYTVHLLTQEDFEILRQRPDRFGEQARLYYGKRGITSAFGIFINGEPAHISWAYTAREYAREPYERFRLLDLEAEIVNCYTATNYRGQGLYPHAIQVIAKLLFSRGVKRVFMNIEPSNESSRRGILKAGFKEDGRVFHLRSPVFNKWGGLYFRLPIDQ